ncbi:hypothetical protein ACF0H5_004953 [Mactra antiquata]
MDDEYTEMNDGDVIAFKGPEIIKTEPIDHEYEYPGTSHSQAGETQSHNVNKNNDRVNPESSVVFIEKTGGNKRNVKQVVERLVKKNDQILAKHVPKPLKPHTKTPTDSHIFNIKNIVNHEEPIEMCTLDDIPAHLTDLVGVNVAPSSEDGLPTDIAGVVGSKCTVLENSSGQKITLNVMMYWCNFCVYKTDKKEAIIHHLMTHRFRCSNCIFQSYSRAAVMQHSLDKHGNLSDPSLKFFALLPDVLETKNTGKRKSPEDDLSVVIIKRERIDPEATSSPDKNEDCSLKISEVISGPEAVNNLVQRRSKSPSPLSPNPHENQSVVNSSEGSHVLTPNITSADPASTKPGSSSSSSLCWNCGYCSFVTMNQSYLKLHLNNAHAKMTHKYVALLATTAEENAKIRASDDQFATSRMNLVSLSSAGQTTDETVEVSSKEDVPNPDQTKADNPVDTESVKTIKATEAKNENKEEQKEDANNPVKAEQLKKLPQTFKCAHCNFSSLKHNLVKSHLMKHHMGLVIYGLDMKAVRLKEKRYVFYCFKNECPFYTKESDEYFEHIDKCVKTIPNKSPSMTKSLASTRNFIEKTARITTENSQYEKIADYSCDFCPYKGSNTWIKKHVLSHHPSKQNIIVRTNKGQGPKIVIYFCNECLWETNSDKELETHMKKHSCVSSNEKQEITPKGQSPSSVTVKPVKLLSPTKPTLKHVKKPVAKTPTVVLKSINVKEKPGYYPSKGDSSDESDVDYADIKNSSNFDYTSHVPKTAYDSAVSRFVKKGNPSVRGSRPARNAALKCKAALKELQLPPLYSCLFCSCLEFGPHLIKEHIMSEHPEKPLQAINVMNKINDPAIKYAFFCPQSMCDFGAHAPSVILKHAKTVHSISCVNKHLTRLMSVDQVTLNDINESRQSNITITISSNSSSQEDSENYQCFYCESSPEFSFRSSICKHFLDEHKTEDCRYHDCDLKIMGTPSKYFMCQVHTCPFSTHEPDDYLLHMLGHQKVKVYECSLCHWFSKTKKEVMDHQNVLHDKTAVAVLEINLDMDNNGCVIRRIGSTVIKKEKL